MKKIFFLILLLILISPLTGFAQIQKGKIPSAEDLNINPSPISNVSEGVNRFAAVVGWVYTIFFVLTVLFVVLAAYKYLTQADQEEKIREAHKQLIYAAVAVVIALLAVGFQAIIGNFLASPTAGLQGSSSVPASQGAPDTGWAEDQYSR